MYTIVCLAVSSTLIFQFITPPSDFLFIFSRVQIQCESVPSFGLHFDFALTSSNTWLDLSTQRVIPLPTNRTSSYSVFDSTLRLTSSILHQHITAYIDQSTFRNTYHILILLPHKLITSKYITHSVRFLTLHISNLSAHDLIFNLMGLLHA